ncbi:MAG: hypothetical protein ACI3VR_05775 [Intestinibacter sp.]|uniref:hypothetical protein n=1 Tax=Intestinibacter sp. TaxID=1965304 RepID=UPI003F178619
MSLGFDKNGKYIFVKEKYFKAVKESQGKITSVEKSFGAKYDGKRVKVVNEKSGLVDGQYYVNYSWCEKLD